MAFRCMFVHNLDLLGADCDYHSCHKLVKLDPYLLPFSSLLR